MLPIGTRVKVSDEEEQITGEIRGYAIVEQYGEERVVHTIYMVDVDTMFLRVDNSQLFGHSLFPAHPDNVAKDNK